MIVFHVFVSFILTVLKYLKCIDCWESLKNKTIRVILQRLALTRNGTKFSSIFFFFFIPLHNFGARTWDFLPYVLWYFSICTHSMSTKPSWYEVRLETEDSLGEFSDDDLMELPGSPTENPSVIYVNGAGCVSTRDLDLSYSWLISLCSVDTHKNPEFCFLGKYWNSGLKSPSESLEPEVTLSQAYNVHRLQSHLLAAKFTAGTYPYTLRFTISTQFQVVLFLFS